MRKTEVKIREEAKEETVDIICNMCGGSCCNYVNEYAEDDKPYSGLVEYTVYGNYWSKPLDDMTEYTFSICESCLLKLFNKFEVPVQITDYSF